MKIPWRPISEVKDHGWYLVWEEHPHNSSACWTYHVALWRPDNTWHGCEDFHGALEAGYEITHFAPVTSPRELN